MRIPVAGLVLALSLSACGSDTAVSTISSTTLKGVEWQWKLLLVTSPASEMDVPDPARYTILFGDDGKLTVKADCNNGDGTYTEDSSKLTIEVAGLARAVCPAGSLANEFLADLGQVKAYEFSDTALVLKLEGTAGEMRFDEGGPPASS